MDTLLQDLRYSVRTLRQSPGYTAAVVLALALGIGASTAIFSIVDAVLLRPLPYHEPDRLVRIYETPPGQPGELYSIAHPTLDDWNDARLRAFDAIAVYGPWTLDLVGDGRPEQLSGAAVSGDFFAVLGTAPARGRDFVAEETRPGGPRAIILSDGLWRRRLLADPQAIGQVLSLDGASFTVVGVMPPDFSFPAAAEFWITTANDHEFDARGARHLGAIGRLTPGVSTGAAQTELTEVEQRLATRFPGNYAGYGVQVIPLHERVVGRIRPVLLMLLAAVGALLLIACANVANLTLARAVGRRREFAVRAALGASGLRLARQLLVENLLLAAAGAVIGVLGAWWVLDVFLTVAGSAIPRAAEIGLDLRVLAATAVITVGTGLVVGGIPAFRGLVPDLHAQLKEGGRSHTAAAAHSRVRSGLVVAQTAVALTLVAAAGLLIRSLGQLAAVDPGVVTERVLTFQVGLPPARQQEAAYVVAFYQELRRRLGGIPGVIDVALASRLPLSGDDHSNRFRLIGDAAPPEQAPSAQDRAVSPGYFRTLGIPVRGREFTDADGPGQQPVAIVNEAFARRYFPAGDPVGQRFVPSRAGGVPRTIIGVAGDARQFGLDTPAEPEFYLPHGQDPWPWLSVVIRSGVEPYTLVPSLERAVWSLDGTIPLTAIRTMDEIRAASVAPRRLSLLLLGVFAGLALTLAAFGTYSVTACLVSERVHEVGIRLALGARPADIVRLMARYGARVGGLGVALGLAGAFAAGRGLGALLYDITPADPWTLAGAALVLGGAIVAASYLPVRRATKVDPMIALRAE